MTTNAQNENKQQKPMKKVTGEIEVDYDKNIRIVKNMIPTTTSGPVPIIIICYDCERMFYDRTLYITTKIFNTENEFVQGVLGDTFENFKKIISNDLNVILDDPDIEQLETSFERMKSIYQEKGISEVFSYMNSIEVVCNKFRIVRGPGALETLNFFESY